MRVKGLECATFGAYQFAKGKRPVAPDQQDNEGTVRGCRSTVQNEEHCEKSRRVESPNRESC